MKNIAEQLAEQAQLAQEKLGQLTNNMSLGQLKKLKELGKIIIYILLENFLL